MCVACICLEQKYLGRELWKNIKMRNICPFIINDIKRHSPLRSYSYSFPKNEVFCWLHEVIDIVVFHMEYSAHRRPSRQHSPTSNPRESPWWINLIRLQKKKKEPKWVFLWCSGRGRASLTRGFLRSHWYSVNNDHKTYLTLFSLGTQIMIGVRMSNPRTSSPAYGLQNFSSRSTTVGTERIF